MQVQRSSPNVASTAPIDSDLLIAAAAGLPGARSLTSTRTWASWARSPAEASSASRPVSHSRPAQHGGPRGLVPRPARRTRRPGRRAEDGKAVELPGEPPVIATATTVPSKASSASSNLRGCRSGCRSARPSRQRRRRTLQQRDLEAGLPCRSISRSLPPSRPAQRSGALAAPRAALPARVLIAAMEVRPAGVRRTGSYGRASARPAGAPATRTIRCAPRGRRELPTDPVLSLPGSLPPAASRLPGSATCPTVGAQHRDPLEPTLGVRRAASVGWPRRRQQRRSATQPLGHDSALNRCGRQ